MFPARKFGATPQPNQHPLSTYPSPAPLIFPRESRPHCKSPSALSTAVPHAYNDAGRVYADPSIHKQPLIAEPSHMAQIREKAALIREHAETRQFEKYKRDMGRAYHHAVSSSYYAIISCVITLGILLTIRPTFVYASADELTSPQLSVARVLLCAALSSLAVFGVHFWRGRPSLSSKAK